MPYARAVCYSQCLSLLRRALALLHDELLLQALLPTRGCGHGFDAYKSENVPILSLFSSNTRLCLNNVSHVFCLFFYFVLSQACVNFYRDALLLEDFAMLNYTAVIKLLKKRDKVAGTRDQRFFMAEVMADQPFAM